MVDNLWFVVIGLLLVLMAMAGSALKRLPLSAAMLYQAAGVALGPHGLGMIRLDPVAEAGFLERFTEVAVLISLFSAGLKPRAPPPSTTAAGGCLCGSPPSPWPSPSG